MREISHIFDILEEIRHLEPIEFECVVTYALLAPSHSLFANRIERKKGRKPNKRQDDKESGS